MKLSIQSNVLRDAINKVLSVVDKKNSRPMQKKEVIAKMQEYLDSNVTIKVGANPIVNTTTECR